MTDEVSSGHERRIQELQDVLWVEPSDLTDEQRERINAALQKCRVEDGSPVALLTESDRHHVLHMLSPLLGQMVVEAKAEAVEAIMPLINGWLHNAWKSGFNAHRQAVERYREKAP